MTDIEIGQKWRHKKRDKVYEIVAIDAAIQISSFVGNKGPYAEMLEEEDWIAYRPVDGYKLLFRMREEFLDGRFEIVPE